MSKSATTKPAPQVSWPSVGERNPSGLEVNLIFTTHQATFRALQTVESLARDLRACVRLRAAIVAPYSLAVEEAPVSAPFMERSLFDLITPLERDGFEATAHLYFCRDRQKALLEVLEHEALVVIGDKKRWWPTDTTRLVKALRSAGHRVIFVDTSKRNNRTYTEQKRENLPVHLPQSVATSNLGPHPGSS